LLDPERIVGLEDDRVVLLDQRRLPDKEVELDTAIASVHRSPFADLIQSRR
jgi:hypothetical protein